MLRGLYTAAFGMMKDQVRQDVLSNNIANSTTTGFKEQGTVTKPFKEVLLHNMENEELGKPAAQQLGPMTFGVYTDDIYTDYSQGIPIDTGSDTDIAIDGNGYFTVRYNDGTNDTVMYTRDGNFHLDQSGNLLTSEGAFVLGRDAQTGEISPMKFGNGKITVDNEGNVSEDSQQKYTMLINNFNNNDGIVRFGKNMLTLNPNGTTIPVEAAQRSYAIKQGTLEQSNVDITKELTDMIVSLRSYQMNQRVLQAIDETLGKAVNQVGMVK